MRVYLRTAIVLLGWCLLPCLSRAQEPMRLSLQEAIQQALTHNPQALAAAARVAKARAILSGASSVDDPVLSLVHHEGRNTGGLDEDVLLTQTIPLGDKQRQAIHAARGELEAALADQAAVRRDIIYNVTTAYYQALRADADNNIATEGLHLAQEFLKTAQTQFQAGDVAHSNVIRSQIALASAQQTLSVAQTERSNAYAALANVIGLPANTPLLLTDKLVAPAPIQARLADLETRALQSRPEIRSAQALLQARLAALHGARIATQPDLFVEFRHNPLGGPDPEGDSVRVGVTFPLVDWGKNRADRQSALAAYNEQEALLADEERSVRLEVETAYRNLQEAFTVLASFQTGRLQRAQELLNMERTGYANRAVSYLELLDAQQTYLTEEENFAHALADCNLAVAALQHAVGGDLR